MSTPTSYYDWNAREHGAFLNSGVYEPVSYDYYGGDELHLANVVLKDSAYVTYDNTHVRLLNRSDINMFDTTSLRIYDSGILTVSTSAAPQSRAFIVDHLGRVGVGMSQSTPVSSQVETPMYDLQVRGSVGVEDYIYHSDDNDTYMLFGSDSITHFENTDGTPDSNKTTDYDEINFRVGGIDTIQLITSPVSGSVVFNKTQKIVDTTIKTSTNTQAIVVSGDGSEIIFNGDNNSDTDLRVKSLRSDRLLYVDSSNDVVEIHGPSGDDTTIFEVKGNDNESNASASILKVSPTEVTINETSDNVNFRVVADNFDTTQSTTDQGMPSHELHDPEYSFYVDTNNGRVGLGTSTPDTTLHVAGSAHIEGDLWVKGQMNRLDTFVHVTSAVEIVNNGTGPALHVTQTGTNPVLTVLDDDVTAFHIEDGGNVGINTANPDRLLDISFSENNSTATDYRDIEGIRVINLDTNVGAKTGVNLSTLGSSVAMIGERITTDSMRLLFVGEINDGNPQPIMSMHNLTGDVAIGKTDATEFSGLTFTGHMLDVLGVIQTRNGTINMGGATYRKASISTPVGDADTPYLQFGVTDVANSSSIGTTGGWRMTNSGLHSSNRDNYITFYADEHANHSIGSRNIDGDESDDIRINTYGSLLINLDSNDNNSDGGDFVVGRHGRNSTITTNNTMFNINGESGQVTIRGMATNDFTAIRTTLGGSNSGLYYTDWQAAGGFTVKRVKSSGGDLSIGIDSTDGAAWTSTGGDIHFKTSKNGTYGERVTIKSDGRVGIGTTSPDDELHIEGVNAPYIKVEASDDSDSGITLAKQNTNKWFVLNDADQSDNFAIRGDGGFADEFLTIKQDGNVGIGTTNPGHKLEVKTPGGVYGCHILDDQGGSLGGLFVSEQGAAADGLELYLKKPAGTTKVRISAVDDNPTYFNAGNVGIGTDSPGKNLHIKEQATVGHGIFLENDEGIVRQILGTASDATDPSLRIRSDSTTIMTLMDTGNVGIGTTSPGGKLTIAGDMYLGTYNSPISTSNKMYYIKSSPFAWPDAANNEIASIGIGAESGGSDDGLITFNTATNVNTTRVENEAMRIASTGNVGIGTTSPIGPLHVSSVGSNTINLTRKIDIRGIAGGAASKIQGGALVDATTPSMGGAIGFALLDSDGTSAGTNTEGYLYFETKDSGGGLTEKVRITSSGRVGIGESNPGSILDIHDPTSAATTLTLGRSGEVPTIKAGGANTDLRLEAVGPGGWLDLRTNNSTKMRVMPNGRVGIGSVNPGATLDVPIPTGGSKITKFGNDITSHYVVTGQANHTLTFACGSYFQAEVVITAHQTNSGNSNNIYIRGIWSNNYTNHEWNELENVGSMTNSALIITNTHNGGDEQNGKLTIQHNYTSGSFEKMTVRITEFYGASHTYTLT